MINEREFKELEQRMLRLERVVDFLCHSDRPEARCHYLSRTFDSPRYDAVRVAILELRLLVEKTT